MSEARWDSIASFASHMRFAPTSEWDKKPLQNWIGEQAESLRIIVVKALARSSEIANTALPLRKQLQDFLRNYLRVRKPTWYSAISVPEAGAALERADRFTDAIAFYEAVEQGGIFTTDERGLAQHRWLVCKKRQLKYEGDPTTDAKARDIQREINQRMAALRIRAIDELPEFPDVASLTLDAVIAEERIEITPRPTAGLAEPAEDLVVRSTPETPSDLVAMSAGPFKLELSRAHNRCNITNVDTMETAFIKLEEKSCGGECDFVAGEHDEWISRRWRLRVRFGGKLEPVKVMFEDLGVTLQLDSDKLPNAK